jgi:hypothetical protein
MFMSMLLRTVSYSFPNISSIGYYGDKLHIHYFVVKTIVTHLALFSEALSVYI